MSKRNSGDRGIPLFAFQWGVPADGFRWERAPVLRDVNDVKRSPKPELVLTSGRGWTETYMVKRYSPLTHFPALFRTFADVPPADQSAILAFANKYGDLGIGHTLRITHTDNPNNQLGVTGETHQDWAEEIARMREAVTLWKLLCDRNAAGLARFLHWEPEEKDSGGVIQKRGGWYYSSHPEIPREKPVFPRRRFQVVVPQYEQVLIAETDILAPASVMIQGWVNKQLEGKATPRLLHDLGLGRMVMMIVPSNLLSAMWMQLAHAIAGNKDYRACKECGNWFEISSAEDARTARRMFCSDACKSRDYRRGKEQSQASKAKKRKGK